MDKSLAITGKIPSNSFMSASEFNPLLRKILYTYNLVDTKTIHVFKQTIKE